MKTKESRRANKVFLKISKIIKTRTSVQVKTHHQKLVKRYETIDNIIYHLDLYIKQSLGTVDTK